MATVTRIPRTQSSSGMTGGLTVIRPSAFMALGWHRAGRLASSQMAQARSVASWLTAAWTLASAPGSAAVNAGVNSVPSV